MPPLWGCMMVNVLFYKYVTPTGFDNAGRNAYRKNETFCKGGLGWLETNMPPLWGCTSVNTFLATHMSPLRGLIMQGGDKNSRGV
ncbi:hypothetical protein CHT99_08610 [Sphingobacterium cellulitidis]|nr:hypothetical protein CHT99_08610 [Sphingobacterium cellulitidis]